MQSVAQGNIIDLDLIVRDTDGELVDPLTITVNIIRPDNSTAVASAEPVKVHTGIWRYSFDTPSNGLVGAWIAQWSALLPDFSTKEVEDPFELRESGSPYKTNLSHIERAKAGTRIALDAVIRLGGELTDVDVSSVALFDPDGNEITFDSDVVHLGRGVYRTWWDSPYDATEGIYTASWSITLDSAVTTFENPLEVLVDEIPTSLISSGVNRIKAGTICVFDGVFRTAGILTNVSAPRVQIFDPSGLLTIDVQPDAVSTGVYRKTTPLGISGIWTIVWSGENDTVEFTEAIEVVLSEVGGQEPEDEHLFGATLAGVKAKLPHLSITYATQPTKIQVEGYIDDIATHVAFRIGAYSSVITDTDLVNRITGMAKYVVELGAAATAQDAAHPSHVGPNESAYGGTLWSRYEKALQELVDVVNNATPGIDPGAGDPGGTSGAGAVYGNGPQFYVGMPL